MPASLKKHQDYDYEQYDQSEAPKYQDFQELNNHSAKLEELFFFGRITIFSLITVLLAFALLAMQLAPFWAFLFSSALSYGLTSLIAKTLKSMIA
ncbi:DUF3270 family protein [Streptococcus iniae]|uniref:DUF3270 domain-containing protein n=1 Tax=Streptococcus iniae TaxID=1346 RepID=UPI0008D9695E|nr:DUF3270 domain-containing protein [Streptococcus iniae]OHX27307.1 hypothetical protein BKX95_05865 [Streptococcus iniae]RLV27526.1 DUF3270 family protein [Streptococcus iniae]